MSFRSSTCAAWLALALIGCTAAPPVATPTPSATPTPTPTIAAPTPPVPPGPAGAISGKLAYPSDFTPPLRIYAVDPAAPGRYRVVHTATNQQTYHIAGVAPGTYFVYASAYSLGKPDAFGGAYTKAVGCGLGASCTDHAPVAVQVRSGAVATGVDVTDWYMPPGTLPPPPTGREPFKTNDQVVVDNPQADEVNARSAAGLGGKVLRAIPNGTPLTIAGGPTTADGYDWYTTQISPDQDVKLAYVAGFALRKR